MDPMKEVIPLKEVVSYQPEGDAIDWRTSLRRARSAVLGHIPLIVMSCVFCLGLLAAYVKIFPPIYRAEAVLQAEPDADVNRNNYYSPWNLFRKGDMKSEPELVTSGRVAREVVKELHLTFNDVHHTVLTHIAYLWTESWIGKQYRAFKEWLFPPDPSAYKPTPEEIETARTVDAFRDGVIVEGVPGTTIGRVVVLAPTWRAAEIANKVVDVYLAERTRMFVAEADKAYQILSVETQRAAADLEQLDRQKFEFDSTNKMVFDFEKDKLLVADWVKLQSSVAEVQGAIAGLQASLDVVQKQLETEPPEIVSARTMQDSKVKSLLQAREFELNTNLLQMRERYLPDSPDIQQLERALAETRAELAKEPDRVEAAQQRIVNPVYSELRQREQGLQSQLSNSRAILAAKRKPLAELELRMNTYPRIARTITEQSRIREGMETRYKLLRDRMMMADVSRASVASAPASVRLIDYASPPLRQSWPKMIYLVPAALGLGLFLGIVMALLAEMFSTRVSSDRLSARPEFPIYATLNLRPRGESMIARADRLPAAGSAIARLRGPT